MNPIAVLGVPPLQLSPKYPWRSYSTLRTHDFIEEAFAEDLRPLRVFVCRSCSRRFTFDSETRVTWAIAADEKRSALQNGVSSRWLSEHCAGRRSAADEKHSKRIKLSRASQGSATIGSKSRHGEVN